MILPVILCTRRQTCKTRGPSKKAPLIGDPDGLDKVETHLGSLVLFLYSLSLLLFYRKGVGGRKAEELTGSILF